MLSFIFSVTTLWFMSTTGNFTNPRVKTVFDDAFDSSMHHGGPTFQATLWPLNGSRRKRICTFNVKRIGQLQVTSEPLITV
ncbi:hypothetical protein L208DRAFT_1416929, partial [Tricholoma matsutake]